MTSATASPPVPSLWRNHNFTIFWLGQALSVIGSAMAGIAYPILVLQFTGSVAQMGIVTAIESIGAMVASLISGLLVDRVNRHGLLIWCDTLNGVFYALLPIVWWLAGPQPWLFYVVAGPLGFLSVTFFIGYSATITNLVDREQLTAANSRLQGMLSISTIIGPLLAGIIIARYGAMSALGINAASFVISVFSLAIIRVRVTSVAAPRVAEAGGRFAVISAGMRFVWRQPTLRWMVIVRSGMLVLNSGAFDIRVFRMLRELHLGTASIGIAGGIGAGGAIVGSIVAPPLQRRLGFGPNFLTGSALVSMAVTGYGLATNLPVIAALGAASSFGSTITVINTMAFRHAVTPDNLQGRVTAFLQATIWVLAPIGAALSTALAAVFGGGPVLITMGLLMLAIVVVGSFTPAHLRHPERDIQPTITPAEVTQSEAAGTATLAAVAALDESQDA